MEVNKYLSEALYDDFYYAIFKNNDSITKYNEILNSDLSILGLWISIFGNDIVIKPRANNIYYADCGFHNADDFPVLIGEKEKAFYCYGCGFGGSFLKLASDYLNLDYDYFNDYNYSDEIVKVFYAFIKKDISFLNKQELEWFERLFKNYNLDLVKHYYEISKSKTEKINNRIFNYYISHEHTDDLEVKMSKRLCCSKKYIKQYLNGNHKEIIN